MTTTTNATGSYDSERMLSRVDEGVCSLDDEWRFTFVNDNASSLLGQPPRDLLGETIWEAVPRVDETAVGTKLRQAMATQTPRRFESYNEERERWFKIRIYPSDDGVTACWYDVTEEHGERLDSQRQRRLFETVFEETEDALIVADTDRRITDFNPAAERLFGYDATDVVGEKARVLYADTADYEEQGATRFNERAPERDETYVVEYERADGTAFEGETFGTSLNSPAGESLAFLGSVRDVSEQVEYEAAIEARNDALQAFHSITTSADTSIDDQIGAVLELGAAHLGLDIAVISTVDDDEHTVEYAHTPDGSVTSGEQFPLGETLCAQVVDTGELVATHDVAASESHPAYAANGRDAYIGAPVTVDGECYGTLNFSDTAPRTEPFTSGERTFVRVLAQWIGKELSRRRTEDRAAASRDRLRQIIDLLPQLVFAKDRDNEYILANQAIADAYGSTVEEVEGSTDADFVTPAEAEQFRQDDLAVIDSGKPKEIPEEQLTTADGETRTLQTTKIPYDPVGHHTEAVLGVATDITEAKQREKALEETTQRLTVALEGTNAGVWELELATDTVIWTDSMEQLFGFEPGATDGTYEEFLDLLHPDDVPAVEESIEQVTDDGDMLQVEYRIQHDDGTETWIEARAELLAGTETPRRLVGIATDITDRKERDAEIELQSAAMETAMDGIAILDGDEYVYMNQAHADVFDYDPEDLTGCAWQKLYGADEIERLESTVFPTLAETGEWRGETLGRKRDGTPVHQDLGLSLLDSGELICTNRDITAQKEREQELQRQRTRIRALFDNSPDGVIVHDETGAVLDANETQLDVLGLDRGDLGSLNVADFEVGIEQPELHSIWAEMSADDVLKVEGEHRSADGSVFPVEIWVNKFDIDGQTRYIAVSRDITERKRREQALEEANERLDLAIEGANLGVWDWDMETDTVTFNEQWASLLDYSLAELEPRLETWEDRVHPADMADVEAKLEAHIAGETELYDCEHRMQTKGGEWIWIKDVGKIVDRDDDGNPTRAVGIHLDITDQKESKLFLEEERDMFAQGPAIVFKWQNAGGWPVEYVSENLPQTLGYTPEQLTSGAVPYTDLIHDDDLDRVASEVDAQSDESTDRFTHEPYRMLTADGDVRWVTDNTKILRTDGEITHYLGYLIDITEQKRLETSLRDSEQSVRELTSIASDTDRDFDAKLSALLELGTERLDLPYGFLNRIDGQTQHVVEAIGGHPELQSGATAPTSESYCRKTVQQSTPLAINNAVDAGWEDDPAYERFDLGCYIGGTVVVDGEPYGTLCFADQHSRDHEFDESERAFVELLVQWISHELATEAFETKLQEINETSQRLMTAQSKDAIGALAVESARTILGMPMNAVWWYDEATETLVPAGETEAAAEVVPEQPTFERGEALAWDAFDTGEINVFRDLSAANGAYNRETAFQSEAIVPFGDYGVMSAASIEPRAFSETDLNLLEVLASTVEAALTRAEREEVLRETQRELEKSNEELEQFAYAASHDLQEPLRTVSSYLTLLERRYGEGLDDDALDFLEFAVDGADRMREMIQALLAYSRVDTRGQAFEPVDTATLFERVSHGLDAKISETDATISTPSTAVTVLGDQSQLTQLFQNLIDNGIKYNTGVPEIDISVTCDDDLARFAVADNGIGMEPDQLEGIFEVFQRLHTHEEFEGAGIGLSLCRKIVERHDGDIRADSAPGEGSTFVITLPLVTSDHA